MRNHFLFKAVVLILFLSLNQAYSSEPVRKKVLILHSYHQGYEWADEINRGILETLKGNKSIEIYIEYMDVIRNTQVEYIHELDKIYQLRYSAQASKPDVVIISDDAAFNFIIEKREKLFKDIPVVFCGVNNFTPSMLKGEKNITGVNESISVRETAEIALKLRNRAKRMAVVIGSSATMKQNLELFRKAEQHFRNRVEIIYLAELEPADLAQRLKALEPEDVVIYLGYLQTPKGVRFTVKKSVELIRKSTNAAIFGCWDFLIPHGVMGGKVVHGYSQGEIAAEKALAILKGRKAGKIPVTMESPNKYLFDDLLLHEYNISEKYLPVSSIITNRCVLSVIKDWDKNKKTGFFGYELFDNHGSIMMLIDAATGVIVDANRAAYNFYGYTQLSGKSISEINILQADELRAAISKAGKLKQNTYIFKHRLADGRIRDVEVNGYPLEINNRKLLFSIVTDITDMLNTERKVRNRTIIIIVVITAGLIFLSACVLILIKNINKRKQSEALLKKSERKLDTMLQTMMEGMVTVDTDGQINYSNQAAEEILNIGKNIQGKYFQSREWQQIDENGNPYPLDRLPLSIALGEQRPVKNVEHQIRASDGETKWLSVNAAPLFDEEGKFCGGIASFRDITKRKLSDEKIKKLFNEKELLLREVHHRIKNNMNTIKGLLTLQIASEKNPLTAESLRGAESRVQSMIMLYDRLYSSENFKELPVKDYLQSLAEEIISTFPNSGKIKIITDIEDFILSMKLLSPLGIIINELITNMMKYAFKDRDSGLITLSASMKNNHAVFMIRDNGVGIDESISFEKSSGFGLELVYMLAMQMGGDIKIGRGDGTMFTLEFKA
jgi:PAS domain S-box-containing protein